jgi:hypothetical protein
MTNKHPKMVIEMGEREEHGGFGVIKLVPHYFCPDCGAPVKLVEASRPSGDWEHLTCSKGCGWDWVGL